MIIQLNANYANRFNIDHLSDTTGIWGYGTVVGKILGWLLVRIEFAIKLTDEKNQSFYLNRKSAIHFINRIDQKQLSPLKENTKASVVKEKIEALHKKYLEASKTPLPPVTPIFKEIPEATVIIDEPYVLKTHELKEVAGPGLCIRTKCKNQECQALNKVKWMFQGIGTFNLGYAYKKLRCVECKQDPDVLLGFTDCVYKVKLVTENAFISDALVEGETTKGQVTVFKQMPKITYLETFTELRSHTNDFNSHTVKKYDPWE